MQEALNNFKYKFAFAILIIVLIVVGTGYGCIKIYVERHAETIKEMLINRIIVDLQEKMEGKEFEPNVQEIANIYGLYFIEINYKGESKVFLREDLRETKSIYDVRSRPKILKNGLKLIIRIGLDRKEQDSISKSALIIPSIIFVGVSAVLIFFAGLYGIRYQIGYRNIIDNLKFVANGGAISVLEKIKIEELDRINKILLTISEVSARKVIEFERVKNELNICRMEIEKLSRFKDGYIKTLSLDIRTPVESICGLMELIENEISDSEGTILFKYISYCKSSVNSLNDILRELLDIDYIESNGEKLIPVVCDISELMNDFTKLFSLRFGSANIFFSAKRSSENISSMIICDSGKITRLLNIFLENSIANDNSAVMLNWDVSESVLKVEIYETINGSKALENADIHGKSSELNLGYFRALSITRTLKGTATINREEGGGKVIKLEIPIQNCPEGGLLSPGNKVQAVIIDQNRSKCIEMAATLSSIDVEAKTFQIPELGYLYLSKNLPDLVFMDLYLDGLSGQKLSSLVKGHGKVVPIVCMVKECDAGKYRLGCEYFDYILAKPIEVKELEKIVSSITMARRSSSF